MSDGSWGPTDEPSDHSPPPSPDDRLWRHPSELGSMRNPPDPPATRRHLGSIFGACIIAGGAMLVGLNLVSSPDQPAKSESASLASTVVQSSSTSVAAPHGWLGVTGVDGPEGATVKDCDPKGPAAGILRSRDVIRKVDATPTPLMSDLARSLRRLHPGDVVVVEFSRDGVTRSVQITLWKGA